MDLDAIIQVNDVTTFCGRALAVDDISFQVREGEVFGFLGPKGAGKTTSIRMMGGLTQPSSGTAWKINQPGLGISLQLKRERRG